MTPSTKIIPSYINFDDLTLVLKGQMIYCIDNEKYVLNEGDAIFVKQGSLRGRTASTTPVDYISFNFLNYSDKFPIHLNSIISTEIKILIRAIDEIVKNNFFDQQEQLSRIIECIIIQIQNNLSLKNTNKLVLHIKQYVLNHLNEKITLNKIGEITHFSPIYCDFIFKKETGKCIIDYLIDERIKKSQELIIESSMSLKNIAIFVGFSDNNYFSRIFKKRTGYTPTQYKKLNLK